MLLPLDVTVDLGTLAQKYRAGGIRLLPLTQISNIGEFLPDAATNFLLSIPLGVLATIGWTRRGTRRSLPAAILAATAFLALIEAAQVLVMSRTADSTDVLMGAAGVAVGAALAGRRLTTSAPAAAAESLVPALAMSAAAALYVIYNWSPFDFEIGRTLARQRIHMLVGVPFSNYYQNPELQAVTDFVTKLLLAMPVGVALRMLAGSRAALEFPKIWWCLALTLAGAFFGTVEVGQVFLASRYPDNTDVFIAMLGCLAGAWLTAQLVPRREPSTSRR
jgi:glycopeptide antibiotics resistance protein